jgi:hypothetical protein
LSLQRTVDYVITEQAVSKKEAQFLVGMALHASIKAFGDDFRSGKEGQGIVRDLDGSIELTVIAKKDNQDTFQRIYQGAAVQRLREIRETGVADLSKSNEVEAQIDLVDTTDNRQPKSLSGNQLLTLLDEAVNKVVNDVILDEPEARLLVKIVLEATRACFGPVRDKTLGQVGRIHDRHDSMYVTVMTSQGDGKLSQVLIPSKKE